MVTKNDMAALADSIESRKADLAKAQAAYDSAQEASERAMSRLQEEFGVQTPQDAQKLLKRLQKKADKLYQEASEALSG